MFDLFVLPFTLGLVFLILYISWKFTTWIKALSSDDRKSLFHLVLSSKILSASREIIMESLLHRRIFKVNKRLGYMHMSLAFGWLLLILAGNLESRMYHHGEMSPPFVPIFFRFFYPNPVSFNFHTSFAFLMDLLLVFVLSGVGLAYYKRLNSKFLGVKRTTQHVPGDRIALTALWFIFPLRLLAESFTSGAFGGGSFLTNTLGTFLNGFLPCENIFYPFWWAYSFALGAFFVALPFSRYMHIPTETLLIAMRHAGIKEKNVRTGFTEVELNACSRCGVCLDTCQIASSCNINDIQSVYQLRDIRYQTVKVDKTMNCLMCGRCDQICPVGIDIQSVRQISRNVMNTGLPEEYDYIKPNQVQPADVIYFAGCMSHLTPSIKNAMVKVFKKSGVNFWFMDEHESICCGRPLLLAGKSGEARKVMDKNKTLIQQSNAKALVTNCPICFKMFHEQYQLDIPVYHHSQYFAGMVENNLLDLKKTRLKAVYHDPCELGRGSLVYEEPRMVLRQSLDLLETENEKENALCCGGSLANLAITGDDRNKITRDACDSLLKQHPEMLITSCPLCKKTFQKVSSVPVYDLAEVVLNALSVSKKGIKRAISDNQLSEEIISGKAGR